MSESPRYFAVIPAAGTGSRVGASLPKQYLPMADATVLEWAVRAMLQAHWIDQVLLVTAPDDRHGETMLAAMKIKFGERLQCRACGGATRRDSVLAGLQALDGVARPDDWILVHDAARPGLSHHALERLRENLLDDPVGGLLALPIADTVKVQRADRRVADTRPRDGLWQAQTPQMFRYGLLLDALASNEAVTDEASAIEASGNSPMLVQGERGNFKVTTSDDLELMQVLLAARLQGTVEPTDE